MTDTGDVESEIHHIISRPQFRVRHTNAASCEFQPHAHSSYTVTTVITGSLQATIAGREFSVPPRSTVFTDIGIAHSATALGVEFVSIGISPVLMTSLIAELGLVSKATEILFRTPITDDEFVAATAVQIASEVSVDRVGQHAMLDSLVRQLGIHLLRHHLAVRRSAQIELSRAGPVDRRIRLALEFIHNNYSRDLALEEVAAAAFLSEYHFARLFKQITGVTPHVYLANLRIEKARELLLRTARPIGEIAAEVGYQSQSHFTRIFKSVTGLTPKAYRNGKPQA